MARPKSVITLDERITKAEESVAKLKDEYNEALSELKQLKAEREKCRQEDLIRMMKKSRKSYEEIKVFLQG